jgi:hypothetical protein
VRYFLTDLVLEGESDEEREDYEKFLNDEMHLLNELAQIGDDFLVYGNVFISIYFPFDRFLICPKCKTQYHIDVMEYKLNIDKLQFTSHCHQEHCKHRGNFAHEDRRSPDRSRIKLIRWNPKQMRLRVHPVSGDIEYYWEMPPDFVQKLRANNKFYINNTPWRILETLKKGRKSMADAARPLFRFEKDSIYHLRESTLAGIPIVGWGIPPILPNFKLAYYIQVLRRFDEAIALDFIVPFRVLYPDYGPSPQQDPLVTQSLGVFTNQMQSMVRNHRNDPTLVQVAPFKVGYQMLGGEAQQLTPRDQIAQALDELLNAIGMPAELYKASLSIQAFPTALRLFEKSWGSLVDGYNDLIGWVLQKISRQLMWGEMSGKLRSVTLADDLERKALSLQAAAGMDISKGTAYRPLGINYMDEQRKLVEEQQSLQQLQQEAMEDQQAQQGLEGGPSGGAGPGGEAGATPGDVHEQAKQMAHTLLLNTPESLRRGELIKIKHSNPTLHALVMQEMDNMRQEIGRQGGAMMMEQAKADAAGGGGGMMAQAAAQDMISPFAVGLLIADQLMEYNRTDLKKIAMDCASPICSDAAKEAFHFVYPRIVGWE